LLSPSNTAHLYEAMTLISFSVSRFPSAPPNERQNTLPYCDQFLPHSPVHFAPVHLTFNVTQPEPQTEQLNQQTTLHLPINPKDSQFSPASPRQTTVKPIVAPTTLCVVDTGSFRNVARISHTEAPTVTTWLS
jgi:hypothetical protein